MSIASALIQATMSNVSRDMKQLEHWLGSLASSATVPSSTHVPSSTTVPSEVSSTTSDDIVRSFHAQQKLLDQLNETVQQFTTTLHAQQHAIHHLTDRIQILEESRSVPETWMDPALVQEEEAEETIYIVRKTEEPAFQETRIESSGIWKREIQEEDVQEEVHEQVHEQVQQEQVQEQEQEEEEEVQEEQEEEVQEEQEEEVQEEEVPVKQVSAEKLAEKIVEVPMTQEVQEEEEEGMELEVITFQGVSYYKDEEGFIYSIDEDEQPSEKAIGYWKKKAQAIAFYRSE